MMPEPSGPRGGSGDIGSPVWPGGVTMTSTAEKPLYRQRKHPRQTASGSGRGSVRSWLLALLGPVTLLVKATVPVVPGLIALAAILDGAPPQLHEQLLHRHEQFLGGQAG